MQNADFLPCLPFQGPLRYEVMFTMALQMVWVCNMPTMHSGGTAVQLHTPPLLEQISDRMWCGDKKN